VLVRLDVTSSSCLTNAISLEATDCKAGGTPALLVVSCERDFVGATDRKACGTPALLYVVLIAIERLRASRGSSRLANAIREEQKS
jgi:hypothetical protein